MSNVFESFLVWLRKALNNQKQEMMPFSVEKSCRVRVQKRNFEFKLT